MAVLIVALSYATACRRGVCGGGHHGAVDRISGALLVRAADVLPAGAAGTAGGGRRAVQREEGGRR